MIKTKKARRTLGSKWTKTVALMRSKEIQPFIPETRLWSPAALLAMLKTYKMVYVKPVHGSFGRGVMRVKMQTRKGQTIYQYQHDTKKRKFYSFSKFHASISRSKLKRAYLIQKGIGLLKFKKRPFDVRVMVQRTSKKPWKATGIIGRLAHPRKIVTNYHSQGKPLPIELLLKPYLSKKQRTKYSRVLKNLSLTVARHLHQKYPGFREIGVDIGIDAKMHPWILEVNTSPDPYIFNQLKDKSTYRRVLHYSIANGRVKKKNK